MLAHEIYSVSEKSEKGSKSQMKINENYIVFPDGTDESANFRGETFTTDSGETMYFAPIRVQTEDDLKTFGKIRDACALMGIGLVDFIIVGDGIYSFREQGIMECGSSGYYHG